MSAARAGLLAAEVVAALSERLSAAEAALEQSAGANALLEEQLQESSEREEDMRAEIGRSVAQVAGAQELLALALADSDSSRAASEASRARAEQAEARAGQAHRGAESAVETARSDALNAAAALAAAQGALAEERALRAAAEEQAARAGAAASEAHAARHASEQLLQRLAAVATSLTQRCAVLERQAHDARRPMAPLSLSALNSLLRAAESELSTLDERLDERLGDQQAEEELRCAMRRTGERIRKLSAVRSALVGRRKLREAA